MVTMVINEVAMLLLTMVNLVVPVRLNLWSTMVSSSWFVTNRRGSLTSRLLSRVSSRLHPVPTQRQGLTIRRTCQRSIIANNDCSKASKIQLDTAKNHQAEMLSMVTGKHHGEKKLLSVLYYAPHVNDNMDPLQVDILDQ